MGVIVCEEGRGVNAFGQGANEAMSSPVLRIHPKEGEQEKYF
jgi:hypothetical protein